MKIWQRAESIDKGIGKFFRKFERSGTKLSVKRITLPPKLINMRIGHNLRRLRESKGWSQEAFALMVGASQSTISNIESNKQDVTWEQI
ncbi:MAG: helix-turn-helix domain-containing protein [Saprospiraceae bacterium]